MNNKDKNYIDIEINKAKEYKIFCKKNNMMNDYDFWNGYLNSLELLKLNYLYNYKF
jgi:hypothetical protein